MPWTDNKMMVVFSAFDKPSSSFFTCYFRADISTWKPETDEEKKAFATLIAPENREELRDWYARLASINAMADALRKILEREIGEPLPVGLKA
jgi:hypothetical protein